MSEKLGIAQQAAVGTPAAPTTGALSTALDRMSFAHDIVMMTDDALAIGLGGLDGQVRFRINTQLTVKNLHKVKITF